MEEVAMQAQHLEVVSIDCLSGRAFLLYFSDGTYTEVSAQELADCFPERRRLPDSIE
jgi:hypothetical protein